MPATACSRLWQWFIHSPGLSARSATSQTSPGPTSNESIHSGPEADLPLRASTSTAWPCGCIGCGSSPG